MQHTNPKSWGHPDVVQKLGGMQQSINPKHNINPKGEIYKHNNINPKHKGKKKITNKSIE